MVSHYEYVQLSANVYLGSTPLPECMQLTWTKLEEDVYHMQHSAFYARAYRKKSTQEIVIAIRGTDPDQLANLRTDITLAMHGLPDTLVFAFEFTRKIIAENPTCAISLTGHSLGALLAQLTSVYFKKPAVVFDSPGIPEAGNDIAPLEQNYEDLITSYFAGPNIINTCHRHIGRRFRLYTPVPSIPGVWNEDMYKAICIAMTAARGLTLAGIFLLVLKHCTEESSPYPSRPSPSTGRGGVIGGGLLLGGLIGVAAQYTTGAISSFATSTVDAGIRLVKHVVSSPCQSLFFAASTYAIYQGYSRSLGYIADYEFRHLLAVHSIENMSLCFDAATGAVQPRLCKAIERWPMASGNFRRAILKRFRTELAVFNPWHSASYPILNMNNQNLAMERIYDSYSEEYRVIANEHPLPYLS